MSTIPSIILADRWIYREGAAFGMKGASLSFHVSTKGVPDVDCSALEKLFFQTFPKDLPAVALHVPMVGPAALHHLVVWMIHILRWAKVPVRKEYRAFFVANDPDVVQLVLPTLDPNGTIVAFKELCAAWPDLVRALPDDGTMEARLRRLMADIAEATRPHRTLGQNPVFIHQIAQNMDLPMQFSEGSHLVLGTGCHAQRLASTITGTTSALAVRLARNKSLTGRILRNAGLPGASNIQVHSFAQACAAAQELTYPVVIKPADADGGQGVFAGITDEATLAWCYERTRAVSTEILIEKHFDGVGHRLTIFQGKLVSATRKIPAGVMGDGIRNVAALVADEQALRDLADNATQAPRDPLRIDDESLGMLHQQGLGVDDVPARDQFIVLRRRNNACAGGTSQQLDWNTIHPANLEACIAAADLLGLDVAGVDLLIADISMPWHRTGALICEVNAQPQVGFDTAEEILQRLFDGGKRIPLTVLVALRPSIIGPVALEKIAHRFSCNAISTQSFVVANNVIAPRAFLNGFIAARTLLADRRVKAALCVLSLEDVQRFGWPIDRFDRLLVHHDIDVSSATGSSWTQLAALTAGYCNDILHLRQQTSQPTAQQKL